MLVRRILVVAVLYAIAGRLGLLLAIPPGYASAIWPAAGVALAAVLVGGRGTLPGIILGSVLVNVWTSLDGTSFSGVGRALIVPLAIGLGAAAQALVGATLVRRWIGFSTALTDARSILRFFGAGVVSTLVNATFAPAVLAAMGTLSIAQLPFSCFTWWVGDSIGVLLVTPLALALVGEPRQLWQKRRLSIGAPILFSTAVVVVGFVYASQQEERRIRNEFRLRATPMAHAIDAEFAALYETLEACRSFIETTSELERESFRRFVVRALERHPSIQVLSWNPRVAKEERRAFEERLRAASSQPSFSLFEQTSDGRRPVSERREYFPVVFVEPRERNEVVVGYDVSSEPARQTALDRARDSGEITMTGRIALVQDEAARAGVLLIAPVYRAERPGTPERRASELRGYTVAGLRIGDVLVAALGRFDHADVDVSLLDLSARPELSVLAIMEEGKAVVATARPKRLNAVDVPLEVAGRRWQISIAPGRDYAFRNRTFYAWSALALGLLFTSLLGAFLLLITGHTASIEKLVIDKTAELNRGKTELRLVIEKAHDAFVAMDDRGLIVEWSPRAEAIFGRTADDTVGRKLAETIIPPQHRAGHRAGLRRFLETGAQSALDRVMSLQALHRDGRLLDVEITISSVRLEHGWRFNAFLRDVTARTRMEEALDRERDRFRAVVESAPVGFFETDAEGDCLLVNPAWMELTGLSLDEALGKGWQRALHPADRDRVFTAWYEAARTESAFALDYRFLSPSGRAVWVSGKAVARRDPSGKVLGYLGTVMDVTERKASELATRESLAEKETLLKEIHHRVKNNLQVIASIMNLHAHRMGDSAADAKVRAVFDEVRGRVHAIALLHERLYQSPDLRQIDMQHYLEGLVRDVARTHEDARIGVTASAPGIAFDIDVAVPVGLIVNELVTNAFKHAFGPERSSGHIDVKIRSEAVDGLFEVSVEDDGVGFVEESPKSDAKPSLGMVLVRSLVRQLDGEISFTRDGPISTCIVRFRALGGEGADG